MKKAIVILADGFEEIEAVTPIDILRRCDVDVTVCGVDKLELIGSRGIVVKADCLLEDAMQGLDAVILPGGERGALNLYANESVHKIIKQQDIREGIIAAICASPALVLNPLGILAGKRVTSYPSYSEKFIGTAHYTNKEKVVIHDHIITSQSAATALEFAFAIAEKLAGEKTVNKVKQAIIY